MPKRKSKPARGSAYKAPSRPRRGPASPAGRPRLARSAAAHQRKTARPLKRAGMAAMALATNRNNITPMPVQVRAGLMLGATALTMADSALNKPNKKRQPFFKAGGRSKVRY